MDVAQLLLDAVGAEAGDRAAHVDVRLVHRVAERLAGVAEHDEPPRLRHERAHVADEPSTTMSTPFSEMPQRAEASPRMMQQPAVRRRAGRLAGVAVDR